MYIQIKAILRLQSQKCSLVQDYIYDNSGYILFSEYARLVSAPSWESAVHPTEQRKNMEAKIVEFRLTRVYMEDATLGVLSGPQGIICQTIELAWRGNKQNVSCIPEGLYPLMVGHSPKFGSVVRVMTVPSRTGIVFHAANNPHIASGRRELRGCIAPCMSVVLSGGQVKGVNSRLAVARFMDAYMAARVDGKVGLAIFQAVPGGVQAV